MLVRKTIFGGIVTLDGGVYVTGAAYGIITDGPSQIGGTLQVIGTQRNFSTLQVDDALDLNAAFDVDVDANTTFDIDVEYFRFSDGTNVLRVDSSNGIQLLGNTGVGASGHADYKFYVTESTNGKLALFKATGSHEAVVTIDAKSGYESQLRFYDGGLFRWQIGNDEPAGVFSISNTEGLFESATDVMKIGGASTYIYGATILNVYLTARTSDLSLLLSAGADTEDIAIFFRQVTTSKYIMGYDDSSDAFRLCQGGDFTNTAAFHVSADNTFRLPSLVGTGVRAVYVAANGDLVESSNYLDKFDATVVSGNDNLTPTIPVHFIFVDIATTSASEVIYDYDVDFDAIEASGQSHKVTCLVKMDCFTALDCNLRVGFRDSSNVDIWTNQVVDGDPAEEWEVEMIWNPGQAEWIVYKNVQTV